MVTVQLVRLGALLPDTMPAVARAVSGTLGCRTEISQEVFDPAFSFDAIRGQYYSTRILKQLEAVRPAHVDRILGLTEVDLFIPILTFVFGEALLSRPPAVISLHRLYPQFYGLPKNPELARRRAQIEAVHELGHTFGLIHCVDYACVMHASRVADEIDLKGPGFCADCAAHLTPQGLNPERYR